VEHWLHERNVMLPVFKQHLERAQARMTRQADKKRVERQFLVGDMVYLRLQPYVQTSVAPRSSQKLGFKYFEPFKVLKRVGAVAYKLQLPPDARIHPVIHVSQLKQAIKGSDSVSHVLPSYLIECRDSVQPCRVVAERFIRRGSKMVPQVKLQWQGLPASCATWEHLYAVVEAFPDAPAWGQAGSTGGGIVTTQCLKRAVASTRRAAKRQSIKEAHLRDQELAQGAIKTPVEAAPRRKG
jgi:hypothetical protein